MIEDEAMDALVADVNYARAMVREAAQRLPVWHTRHAEPLSSGYVAKLLAEGYEPGVSGVSRALASYLFALGRLQLAVRLRFVQDK